MTTDTRPVSAPTISERLADYVVGLRYEDLPEPVVEKAKDLLIYHFGAAFRGRLGGTDNQLGTVGAARTQRAVSLALALSGDNGHCTIIGERRGADPLDAVFANAFLMNGLDDSMGAEGGGHPGIMTQTVAWAAGETARASGRDLLAAVVAGYDIVGKLGSTVATNWRSGPRGKHVFGPFGGAATAARLLNLSRAQTVDALGHAGQAGTPAGVGMAEGTEHIWIMKPSLARQGLWAAMLAQAGMAETPSVIEGSNGVYRSFFSQDPPDCLTDKLSTLGHEFEILNSQRQMWNGLGNIIPMKLTEGFVNEHALTPSRVATVEVTLPQENEPSYAARDDALYDPEPNVLGRHGSVRFGVVAIIADGRFDPNRFDDPPDANLRALLEKVTLRYESGHPKSYARVELTTTDGQRYAAERDTAYVPPPIDWTEWLADGGQTILSQHRLTHLAELIRNLEDVPDVSEVMACVVPDAAS